MSRMFLPTTIGLAFLAVCCPRLGSATAKAEELPRLTERSTSDVDWLIDPAPYTAGVFATEHPDEIALDNGLVRRTFRISPNAATVGLDQLSAEESLLRGVKPEATISIDGREYAVGGLTGQPNYAYLLPEWLDEMGSDANSLLCVGYEVLPIEARLDWKSPRHHAPQAAWPPHGTHLRLDFEPQAGDSSPASFRVSVHYELYDGVPVFCKWLTVDNRSEAPLLVDHFVSELLAIVEQESWVDAGEDSPPPVPQSIHVETDFAFGGMNSASANEHIVHWRSDPQYTSQVNYRKVTPCLLMVEPTYGPAQRVEPGESFESCRAFEVLFDSTERERRGLTLRRMYRTVAPWVTENPLMHHMLVARPDAVRAAIDQAKDVGFEMIIMSFGSGFDMDNTDPSYLATWRDVADHAERQGIEIGSYSLLSSRRAPDGNMIVSPPGQSPRHGQCPALTSPWGQEYFARLRAFYDQTGFDLLEHDGSYPGDVDVTPRPPLQQGELDSRWAQWRVITEYYRWCRERGIYLNVPDYYFLSGSNKCGMGYREVNWSLPRDMQVIHTRQNIYDGTWDKTPSMGWMFVPLAQYHGGGAAATIEPLHEHLDHYERMLMSNLALGVQACYRGPRLYDSPETREVVKRCTDWYHAHREILESDLIHGRRADGRDLDWMLHVNPQLEEKGMLVVFNPASEPVTKTLRVDLYYTGLTEIARISHEGADEREYPLDRRFEVELEVNVPARGMAWFSIR
ncbi:MAG: hypothetical protein KDA83_14115 [Planctomycetales bacterium]|nr:hypothetical protein [Planctomycetales bacterium]